MTFKMSPHILKTSDEFYTLNDALNLCFELKNSMVTNNHQSDCPELWDAITKAIDGLLNIISYMS